jgi:hypothetical protein
VGLLTLQKKQFKMSAKTAIAGQKPKTAKMITKEQFPRRYSNREDGFKYEFNQGIVEKTTGTNQQQATIQGVIFRFFIKTKIFQDGGLYTP